MHTPPITLALLASLTVLMAGCGRSSTTESSAPPDSVQRNVEQAITSLNEMRESLAATIDTPAVDKGTFERVCKPVGIRAQQMAIANGWTVQQLAKKYRNPSHELDPEARRLYDEFASSPERTDRWIRTVQNGREGWRYARRITVRSSCLSCHGPKEQRPTFVQKGYPKDRAYGFETGDLRGIYSVFVPDSSPDTSTAHVF